MGAEPVPLAGSEPVAEPVSVGADAQGDGAEIEDADAEETPRAS